MIRLKHYTLIFLFLGLLTSISAKADEKIVWKNGIAIIDGKASYIDVNKLDQTLMTIEKRTIEQYKKENKSIINAGEIYWVENELQVYNVKTKDTGWRIFESEVIFKYKVIDNKMFISKDARHWDKLEIKIVDDNPKQREGKDITPILMIIHLKCKWFEGYYKMLGESD